MIGQTLGHYRIEAQLGAGGMGVVYRARDTQLDRTVAVKVIGESFEGDPKARARLLQEARAASALNHPNICTIHEVGEARGRAFIVMEYVEGRPLSAVTPAEGLPVDTVIRYGSQIADALAHAHERGVVHRDLKSSNIIVTPQGRPKVLDFGLAKRLHASESEGATRTQGLTEEGTIVGTLAYMSPEALRGEPVDGRSDIWSLGVMLYEMSSGRLPFQGKSPFELTAAVLREPIPAAAIPAVRPIVERCLARQAGERYQRAGEVRAALEAIGSASQAMPAAAAPPVSRRRWLWGMLGVAVLGAATVVGVVRWRKPWTYAPIPSKVPEANEYLQRALLFITTQDDLPRARQLLEKALELDPKFAHARGWYGFTHILLLDSGRSNDTTWLYKAEEELRRALADDPNSARAHAALAPLHFWRGRKELMLQEAQKTIELDPDEIEGYSWLAIYHQMNGEYEQSQALLKKLLDANPLFFPARWNVGENLRQTGDPAGAIRGQQKILEQDPESRFALIAMALAHMTAGDAASARQVLERVRPRQPQNYVLRLLWALQLALEGKREEALREMDSEVLKYCELGPPAPWAAEFYAVLGDKPKALDWLDRAARWGDERAEWFERDPLLKNIREETRFRQILESIRYRREQRVRAAR
jgi:serine/threonine protein kinase/Flp pilus assembly protein TadD